MAFLAGLGACTGSGGPSSGGGGGGGKGPRPKVGPVDSNFFVQNESSKARQQTIRASVPFAETQCKDIRGVGVEGFKTSWRVLQNWPDGSVKIAQATFVDSLKANERKLYKVSAKGGLIEDDFKQHPWTSKANGKFVFYPEVRDVDNVPYFGFTLGEGEILESTTHCRTRFWRVYLRNGDKNAGIKRDYLTARIYMTEYRDMPFVSVDLVLCNDYLGSDTPGSSTDPNLFPLGSVRVKKALCHIKGGRAKMRMRERQGAPLPIFDSGSGIESWGLLDDTYLGDAASKHWSFLVYFEDSGAKQGEKDEWRSLWDLEVTKPLRPLATFETWVKTDALGVCGGPTKGPDDVWDRVEREVGVWRGRNHFGTFGSWGDPKNTHTTGTPRNFAASPELIRAVQAEHPGMLEVLEGKAWQQSVRPVHLWGLDIDQSRDIYMWFGTKFGINGKYKLSNDTLGRYLIHANDGKDDPYKRYRVGLPSKPYHDFNALDAEHVTIDMLFDYYTVSGSFWARHEIEQTGQWCRGLWRFKDYPGSTVMSTRAEGWMMQLFVQAYVATGIESFKVDMLRRITEITDRDRHADHPSRSMKWEKNYANTKYPKDHWFYMPWQHSAVVYGFLAANRFFGSELAMKIAEDAIFTADYASVENFTDPVTKKFSSWNMRYYVCAKIDGPYNGKTYSNFLPPIDFFDTDPNVGSKVWGSTKKFFMSAAYMLAARTEDPAARARALKLGDHLLGDFSNRVIFWDKWASTIPENQLPGVRKN